MARAGDGHLATLGASGPRARLRGTLRCVTRGMARGCKYLPTRAEGHLLLVCSLRSISWPLPRQRLAQVRTKEVRSHVTLQRGTDGNFECTSLVSYRQDNTYGHPYHSCRCIESKGC